MIKFFRKPSVLVFVCMAVLLLNGCASTAKNPVDPFESYNRKMYTFNSALDTVIVEPTVKAYTLIIPWPIRRGVDNFFINLYQIPTIANDLLQGEIKLAFKDTGRFLINSTFGIVGLFDVASPIGLERNYQDFGITLAKWGDNQSPYVILPLFGPSTVRDTFGLAIDYRVFSIYSFIEPLSLRYGLLGAEAFAERASYQELVQISELIAIDPYILQRDAYLQRRKFLIGGGQGLGGIYIEDEQTPAEQPDSRSLYIEDFDEVDNKIGEEFIA